MYEPQQNGINILRYVPMNTQEQQQEIIEQRRSPTKLSLIQRFLFRIPRLLFRYYLHAGFNSDALLILAIGPRSRIAHCASSGNFFANLRCAY